MADRIFDKPLDEVAEQYITLSVWMYSNGAMNGLVEEIKELWTKTYDLKPRIFEDALKEIAEKSNVEYKDALWIFEHLDIRGEASYATIYFDLKAYDKDHDNQCFGFRTNMRFLPRDTAPIGMVSKQGIALRQPSGLMRKAERNLMAVVLQAMIEVDALGIELLKLDEVMAESNMIFFPFK